MGSKTRAMAKKEEAGKKAEADKKGLETKSLEGSRSVEKTKPELTGEDRRQIWKFLRENETYKAMRKRTKKNLFDPTYEYKLSNEIMQKEGMKWASSQTLRTTRMLAVGRYVVKWIGSKKDKKMTLEEARMEMWRKMIMCSQADKAGED